MTEFRAIILLTISDVAGFDRKLPIEDAGYQAARRDVIAMLGQVEQCPEGERAGRCFDLAVLSFQRCLDWLPFERASAVVCSAALRLVNHWLDELIECEALNYG
jgi:hypothetical protein